MVIFMIWSVSETWHYSALLHPLLASQTLRAAVAGTGATTLTTWACTTFRRSWTTYTTSSARSWAQVRQEACGGVFASLEEERVSSVDSLWAGA